MERDVENAENRLNWVSIWTVRQNWTLDEFSIIYFKVKHWKSACKMCKCNCASVCTSWQQWIKAILILLYTLFALIVVPWLIVYTVKDGFDRKDQLLLVGGLFVLTSVPYCIWHILQHMLHFTKPILQKPIIRILWMVPIYSGNAVSAIAFNSYYTLVCIR